MVVTLDQHALLAEGVVVERTMDLVHPLLLGPGLGGADQQAGHFDVLDAVEPAEAGALPAVELVVTGVDHPGDAADHPVAVERQPEFVAAVFERRAVLVQFIRELDKLHQVLAGLHFTYLIAGHIRYK